MFRYRKFTNFGISTCLLISASSVLSVASGASVPSNSDVATSAMTALNDWNQAVIAAHAKNYALAKTYWTSGLTLVNSLPVSGSLLAREYYSLVLNPIEGPIILWVSGTSAAPINLFVGLNRPYASFLIGADLGSRVKTKSK